MTDARFDLGVVGGGIVGLAVAMAATARFPGRQIVVLEKETGVGRHQTGRNSGVVHSGLYYRPGSEKARLCVEGGRLLREFCAERGLPFMTCGKVVVATGDDERAALEALLQRGAANGVPGLRIVGPEELREREPAAAGVAGLVVPDAAITDYARVAGAFAGVVEASGGMVRTGARLLALRRDGAVTLAVTTAGEFAARVLVNCAGLWSDAVARLDGLDPGVRIVPFRGEYYTLGPQAAARVRGLVYPVPDPRFPFLGVHLTRRVDGSVEAGPNAVLALAREGYRWRDISARDLGGCLLYPGFARMAWRHWPSGLREVARSFSARMFLADLRRLMPGLSREDLRPGGSGVRAQAVAPDGALVDDFRFVRAPGRVHVLNVPSPAATASIAIGRHIAGLMDGML
jgi:(S)-2-hydroxyglutarate dehydrogenase